MNNLRVFLNGCENETKTVDMRQSTLPNSTTPTSDKFIWLLQSTTFISMSELEKGDICYLCLRGPL